MRHSLYRLIILPALVTVLSLISCGDRQDKGPEAGKTPIVSIDDNYLYKEDLLPLMPYGLSPEDSAVFTEKFIKSWASDVLLYQNAKHNVADSREIEEQVDNYRRSLILHSYQQKLTDEKLVKTITEEQMRTFYEDNSALFINDDPMIKGLLLVIPVSAPDIARIRSIYKRTDDNTFEEIEKYSIRNAERYDSFYDKWTKIQDIQPLLPSSGESLQSMLKNSKCIELKDKDFYYFLNVSEILSKGEVKPFEEVKSEIRGLLLNNNQVQFMQQIKDELYEVAVERDKLQYYN